jgi:hypothetical protein
MFAFMFIIASSVTAPARAAEISATAVYRVWQIRPEQELLIRDPSVLDSNEAEFSFSSAMSAMKPASLSLPEFLREWSNEWSRLTCNGHPLDPRPAAELFREPFEFHPIAFVYRPDLSTPAATEGELRAVYALRDTRLRAALNFFVIIEYGLSRTRDWAHEAHSLLATGFGPAYNARLATLLRTARAEAATVRVRTNDFFLAFRWELREFARDGLGFLRSVPLAQTPADAFLEAGPDRERLGAWVSRHREPLPQGYAGCASRPRLSAGICPASSLRDAAAFPFRLATAATPVRRERDSLRSSIAHPARRRGFRISSAAISTRARSGCGGDSRARSSRSFHAGSASISVDDAIKD